MKEELNFNQWNNPKQKSLEYIEFHLVIGIGVEIAKKKCNSTCFCAFLPTSMMLREGSTVDAGNDLNAGDCSMIITHSAGRSGGGVFPPRQHNLIHPLDLISSSSISITACINIHYFVILLFILFYSWSSVS